MKSEDEIDAILSKKLVELRQTLECIFKFGIIRATDLESIEREEIANGKKPRFDPLGGP